MQKEEKKFGHGVTKGDVSGIPRKRRTVAPTATAGVSGTPVVSGRITNIEKDFNLVGRRRYVTYSNMLANTCIVAAGVRYFLNLVSKPAWRFEAPEGSGAEGEKLAKLIEHMTKDMKTPWHRVVRRAAMYRFYGYSIQEWTSKLRKDGHIGFYDIAPRPQHTIEEWDCDEGGHVKGVVQVSPLTFREIYLPRKKLIYTVDDSLNDSPEGLGLFRHIVNAQKRLRRFEQLEGYGFESDLRGIPIARAPLAELDRLVANGDLDEAQKAAIIAPLKTFMQNHIRNPELGLMLDSLPYESADEAQRPSNIKQWDMELMKAESSTQPEIASAIERLNREIARVLGVEQLLLGDNGVGSFAMAKEKSHNFALIIDSTLQELTEQFANDYVERLFELNGWDKELMPEAKTDKLQYRNIEDVTNSLEQMSRAGAILAPNDPAINVVRDQLGLPDADGELPMLDAALISDPKPEPEPKTE